MKFDLLNNKKPAFGLDISGNSFKLIQMDRSGKEIKVKACSEVPVPRGLVVNEIVTDSKNFTYLIKQALDKPQFGQFHGNYVVVSLPESKSFVRVIQIPQMSDSEAEVAVPVEAESFIPLPVDQVYLDWQKIGVTEDSMNILIVASPREFIDKYLTLLDAAGLKTAALEVESQSCLRAVLPPKSQDTVLVVDLDAYRSSLVMVEEGNLQFTSTVPIAGNNFTENIAKILGVSAIKAEEIKKKVGIANTADYPNIKIALLPVLNNLTAEIKSILRFHADHSQKKVSKILLVGGSARLKNLTEFLAPQFSEFGDLPVEVANPWVGLPELKQPPLNPAQSLGFATAIGLAARGVDFTL
jgi:type IV pilus assembly protein PilM